MTAFKTGLSLLATIAIFAVPTAAHAEYLIPPSNSAATQYTEAVPTAGGPKATNPSNHRKGQSPNEVLGGRNAERLDAQGPVGRAVAEVAAETAPVAVGSEGAAEGKHPSTSQPGTNDTGSGGGNGAAGEPGNSGSGASVRAATLTSQEIPDGSSGLGEVLAQATGSSDSGQLGLLLPLIVLGAIAWSVAYVLRRRKRPIH